MFLHEEYINRHGLSVPVVLYTQKTSVFLKSKCPPYNWRILAFSWREPDRHPGFFEMSYKDVVHNGWESDTLVKDILPPRCWNWDQYEVFLLKKVADIRYRGYEAIHPEERLLAAWIIFLTMYDSWLASHTDQHFYKLSEIVLRSDLSKVAREEACILSQQLLAGHSQVNDVWSYQLLPLAQYNSEWLVRLINE